MLRKWMQNSMLPAMERISRRRFIAVGAMVLAEGAFLQSWGSVESGMDRYSELGCDRRVRPEAVCVDLEKKVTREQVIFRLSGVAIGAIFLGGMVDAFRNS